MRLLLTLIATQDPVDTINQGAGALERGGLYTVCAALVAVVVYLYLSKERVQARYQDQLLKLVEEQTRVITKQVLLTEKVEDLLRRVATGLEDFRRKE